MSFSLDDLQKEFQDQVGESGISGGGFKTIALFKVEPAYQVFASMNIQKLFPYEIGNEKSKKKAQLDANTYAKTVVNDSGKTPRPQVGMAYTIFAKDILLGNQLTQDWNAFVSAFKSEKNGGYGDNPGFANKWRISVEESQLLGTDKMPYDAFVEAIVDLYNQGVSVPFGFEFYALLENVVDGYAKCKGQKTYSKTKFDEDGNVMEYDKTIHVIKQVFQDRKEALKVAQEIQEGINQIRGEVGENNGALNEENPLSLLAQTTWKTLDALQKNAQDIHTAIKNAQEGIDVSGKNVDKMPPAIAIKYVAEQWGIETADVRLLKIDQPF